jgi:hypothetical protein
MSSANAGISVRVVKVQLRMDASPVTCIDVTPEKARLSRLLEVSTLQIHRVPMSTARAAPLMAYDPAHLAALLYRVVHQCESSGTAYEKEVVQRVANSLTETVNEVIPVAPSGRYSRRLTTD